MDKVQLKKLRKELKQVPNAKKTLAAEFGINVRSVTNYLHNDTKRALHVRASELVIEFNTKHKQGAEYIEAL